MRQHYVAVKDVPRRPVDRLQKTTIYLPVDMHRQLSEVARRRQVSQAELIREAIRAFLAAQGQSRLRSLGAGRSNEITGRTARDWLRENWHPP
jgi:predicted transcriptional regulator